MTLARQFRNHGKFAAIEQPELPEQPLTGIIQGKDASDLEERFYRAAWDSGRVRWVVFRRVFGAPFRSMFGAIELDFLVNAGWVLAVQVDAKRFHTSAEAIQRDLNQDAKLLRILRSQGVDRIQRIQGKHLANQERANQTFNRLLAGTLFTKWS